LWKAPWTHCDGKWSQRLFEHLAAAFAGQFSLMA
jgi:hypothetical protein